MSSVATSFIISLKGQGRFTTGDTSHISLHFQKNQDHVTSLLFSKNDYFLRQLHKELEHHVYPMLADEG